MLTNLLNNPAISRFLQHDSVDAEVLGGIRKVTCKAGDVICEEGTPGEGFYLVVSGAAVGTVQSGKDEVMVSSYAKGGFFGLAALAEGQQTQHLTVKCTQDAELLFVPAEVLFNLLRQEPMMWSNILGALSKEIISIKNKMKIRYSEN